MPERKRGNPKLRTGVVIGNKMDKTVVVEVRTTVLHPRYRKYIQRRRRLKAHDEANACKLGDQVEIIESRPKSKTKNWRVRKVLGSA